MCMSHTSLLGTKNTERLAEQKISPNSIYTTKTHTPNTSEHKDICVYTAWCFLAMLLSILLFCLPFYIEKGGDGYSHVQAILTISSTNYKQIFQSLITTETIMLRIRIKNMK